MVEGRGVVGRQGGVAISINIREERGVRYLHFGSELVQGAMRIARPSSLEIEYTRELMFALLLRAPGAWPARVLQIGLGSASVTRFLYRHRPRSRIHVVELVPDVVAAARQFFKLPDDTKRMHIEIGDGHDYVASSKREFDFIVVDGFDERGFTGMLDTLPFYVNCRARLGDAGIAAVNLVDRRRGSVAASCERLREAFEERVLVLPRGVDGNTIALAVAGSEIRIAMETLQLRARKLRVATGLDLSPTLARLEKRLGTDAILEL